MENIYFNLSNKLNKAFVLFIFVLFSLLSVHSTFGQCGNTYSSNTSISSFTYSSPCTVTVNTGVTLTVTGGAPTVTGGLVIQGGGTLLFNNNTAPTFNTGSSFTVASGTTVNLSAGASINGGSMTVKGTLDLSPNVNFSNSPSITINSTGTLDINYSGSTFNDGWKGGMTDNGTVNVTGSYNDNGDAVTGSGSFTSTGNMLVNSGSGSIFGNTGNCGGPCNGNSLCSAAPSGTLGTITGTSPVCAGATGITYSVAIGSATGGSSYSWTVPTGATITSGSTTNSITVTMGSTTGNVVAKPVNSCGTGSGTSSKSVTVNAVPSAAGSITTNSSTVTPGQTGVTYSIAAVTGASTYTWSLPSGTTVTAGANTNNITVSYSCSATTGSQSVTVTPVSAAGCSGTISPTLTIIVSALPTEAANTPVASANPVSPGQTGVTYSVPTVSQASTYSWTVPAGATITSGSNSNNITVTYTCGAASGNVSVIPTNAKGCSGTTSPNLAVTVNALPTAPNSISPITAVCNGSTVTYTENGGTGTTYTWTITGGAGSSTTASDAVTWNTTGTQTISVAAVTNGCTSSVFSQNITVNPTLPVSVSISPSSNSICSGTSVTFTATPTNGGNNPSYQWQVNGSNVGTNSTTYTSAAFNNNDAVTCVLTSNATCATGSPATSSSTMMIVNTIPTAPTSISPTTTAALGTTVTYTESGGTGTSYAWTITGGTTSSTSSSAAITWTLAGTEQIKVAAVANGCTSSVFTQNIIVISSETWTGATNTDWNTTGNWDSGIIPTSQMSVIIPNVASKPVISVTETANVAALTVNSSSSLTNTGVLNVNGNLTNNGTLTLNNGSLVNLFGNLTNTSGTITDNGATITFEGSLAQTFSGPAAGTTLSSVTVNNSNGLTLNNKLTISDILTLNSGTITSNGNLTVNLYTGGISGAGTGTIGGNITVTKKVDTVGYHYISAPLFPSTAADISNAVVVNYTGSLYYYNETNPNPSDTIGWVPITTSSYALTAMQGYALYFFSAPQTLQYTKTYTHNSSYSIGLTSTVSGNPTQDGWNLVGNPYPSSIDWDASSGWTKTGIDDAVYFYNPVTGNYASYISGIGVNGGTNIIPSMQAFWVHVSSDGTSGMLGINNNARTTGVAPLLWRTGILTNYMTITSKGPDSKKDETVIRLLPNATYNYDPSYDAYKMTNDADSPNLFTTIRSNQYSINSLSDSENFTIPLNYVANKTGNVTLTFDRVPSISNYQITLLDTKANTQQDLKATSSYTYNAIAKDTTTRLYINFNNQFVTTPAVTGKISKTDNVSDVVIINNNSGILINFLNIQSHTADITLYNILGEAAWENKNSDICSGNYTINADALPEGIYIVKVIVDSKSYSKKVYLAKQ